MLSPGSITNSVPDPDEAVRLQRDIQRTAQENASARSLQQSQIGAGGLLVNNGGSITVEGGGTITLPTGTLSAANVTATAALSGATVTAGTDVNAGGNVNAASGSVTGANVFGTSIFAANAGNIAGNITASRTTVWARNSDGYLGNTLSSIRFKTGVVDTDIDPLAVLNIGVKHYQYIAEVRKRDDPTYEEYVGPDYHVALEVGMIAEDLHAAGLWQFVAYERETVLQDDVLVERLRLDSSGQPIPESIHYILWAMAVLVATQHVWAEHLKLAEKQAADRIDIDRILAHLGI